MNKTRLYSFFAASALLLTAVSCSQDEFDEAAGNKSEVSFSVNFEGAAATRAIGDGTQADKLVFAVFNEDGTKELMRETRDENVTYPATIKVSLAKNQTYRFAFWAQDADCQAYDVTDLAAVTVKYEGEAVVANDETRDAFFASLSKKVEGSFTETVYLKRPFAQLNVGVTKADWTAAVNSGVTVKNSSVVISDVATTLNLLTGEVSGKSAVTFALNTIPGETLEVDLDKDDAIAEDEKFHYLSMNYLLVNNSLDNLTQTASSNVDAEFSFQPQEGGAAIVSKVPGITVQRNHRTNIVGRLLTGDATFNVYVDQNFVEGGDYNIWDGEASDNVEKDETANAYIIMSAADLAWVAEQVNSGNSFKGETVKLGADISLAGNNWTPIGTTDKTFEGTFDGDNHVIKNLLVSNAGNYVGLFGKTAGGAIKNLTIENAEVSGNYYVAAVAGCAYTTPISNVTVKGTVKIDATGQDAAVVTGYTYANITDVTVDVEAGSYVKADSYFGGVVGYPGEGSTTFTRVKSNIDVIGKQYMIGGITGIAMYGNNFIDCECSGNVYLTAGDATSNNRWMRIGGIAGSWMEHSSQAVTLTNCKFTGTLSSKKTDGTVATSFDNYSLVGRGYNYDGTGTLIINGINMLKGLEKNSNGAYEVSNAFELKVLNDMMLNKTAGKNVVVNLTSSIDFTGYTWTPVDSHADTPFTLSEINGNNNTISNLTINGQAMFTRFAGTNGGVTIKDITFEKATVNSTALNTSILTVQSYQNVLLDNVDVKGSTIIGAYKVAPLIATVYNENPNTTVTATLKNCDVEDCTVKATQYDFCTTGMVAFVYAGDNDKITFENCTVKNVKLFAPNDNYKAHAAVYTTGSGSLYDGAEGVTVTNVTFEAI